MLSVIASHACLGVDGLLIRVEVDIRKGLPGVDIVGLPDNAVREARERVRVAIRNSGFRFPSDRILVNLAPAGIRKEGASFDLPIALGILSASGQLAPADGGKLMVLGELNLDGAVRPVTGVLSAVGTGLEQKIRFFLVPTANVPEAQALCQGRVYGIRSLEQAFRLLEAIEKSPGKCPPASDGASAPVAPAVPPAEDFRDLRGQMALRRALEIACAGRHHLLVFGPPGSGKTMAVRRLPGLLPPLTREESLAVTRIHSIAGVLPRGGGLIRRPPFRAPHHSASSEGIIGGGKTLRPGEVSLAHMGILFLDETAEFRASLLQMLREPVEEGSVSIARAGSTVSFPADFQLVMAVNPCPCGNLGRDQSVCVCSGAEIRRYWQKIGGALLDRIDMRVPVKPVSSAAMQESGGESSEAIGRRIAGAVSLQRERYRCFAFSRNSRLTPGFIDRFCAPDRDGAAALATAVEKLSLSSRAYHSVLKIARTIADLEGAGGIRRNHVLEAIQYRRYGEGDLFWDL
jgi:magnesium chelatase family protein